MKYDYFVGGRWRNHEEIQKLLDALRSAGKKVYCFLDNSYVGDGIDLNARDRGNVENFMRELETTKDWQTNPTFRQIFENDMNGIRGAKEAIFVFPAGLSAHMELGAAYGMGKKCYGIGNIEKHETLYLMMENIYDDVETFMSDHDWVRA